MTTTQFPQRIVIREVGLREGFQALSKVVSTDKKIELLQSLIDAGIRNIEVTSFVRTDKVPQLADAEKLVSRLPELPGCTFTALYLNQQGFKRAEATGRLHNTGWFYTSPSNTFLRHNNNSSIDECLQGIPGWISLFRAHGKRAHGLMVSNAFGCAYEGEISSQSVLKLVERYAELLAQGGEVLSEVCLADTVGMGHPQSIERCVSLVRSLGVPVSLHLHDTRGLGLTNAYVGLQLGIAIFETSVGGIGGCPFTPGAAGNIATEDFVYLCHTLGVETGLGWQDVSRAAQLAEKIIGAPLPGRIYKTVVTT